MTVKHKKNQEEQNGKSSQAIAFILNYNAVKGALGENIAKNMGGSMSPD